MEHWKARASASAMRCQGDVSSSRNKPDVACSQIRVQGVTKCEWSGVDIGHRPVSMSSSSGDPTDTLTRPCPKCDTAAATAVPLPHTLLPVGYCYCGCYCHPLTGAVYHTAGSQCL